MLDDLRGAVGKLAGLEPSVGGFGTTGGLDTDPPTSGGLGGFGTDGEAEKGTFGTGGGTEGFENPTGGFTRCTTAFGASRSRTLCSDSPPEETPSAAVELCFGWGTSLILGGIVIRVVSSCDSRFAPAEFEVSLSSSSAIINQRASIRRAFHISLLYRAVKCILAYQMRGIGDNFYRRSVNKYQSFTHRYFELQSRSWLFLSPCATGYLEVLSER